MLFQVPVAISVTIQLLCVSSVGLHAWFGSENKNLYVW